MNEPTLYQRVPMPPEPWTHEDNPDWILVEGSCGGDAYMLVPADSQLPPPCEHGHYSEHVDMASIGDTRFHRDGTKETYETRFRLCTGKPKDDDKETT